MEEKKKQIPPIKPPNPTEVPPWYREGINLKMSAKGYYYWEINAYGDLDVGLVNRISKIDDILRKSFPQNVMALPEKA